MRDASASGRLDEQRGSDARRIAVDGRGARAEERRAQPPPRPPCRTGRTAARQFRAGRRVGPSATIRPERRIATRSHSCSTSGRTWLERKTVVPSRRQPGDQLADVDDAVGVEAVRRLVEDHEVRAARAAPSRGRDAGACRSRTHRPSASATAASPTRSSDSVARCEPDVRPRGHGPCRTRGGSRARRGTDRTPAARSASRHAGRTGRAGRDRLPEDPAHVRASARAARRGSGSSSSCRPRSGRGSRRRRRPGRRGRSRRRRSPRRTA